MRKSPKTFSVGRFQFKNKGEAAANAKRILYCYPLGEIITECDKEFLDCLINNHPESETKIGCGISGFMVRENVQWKAQRMFVLIRNDGTSTDFSYLKCLHQKDKLSKFREACRRVVVNDVLAFKNHIYGVAKLSGEPVLCSITGQPVEPEAAHVDHAPPNTFRAIVTEFIDKERIDVGAVALSGAEDNTYGSRINDPNLAKAFRAFHASAANLRITTASANLRLPK